MHQSIPLIIYDDNHRYSIPQQTQQILRSFAQQNVAVLSVIGKPKTGKSYILNHIAENPNAFEVNAQVTKSTKGIQMSTRLYNIQDKKVLLLDNQSFNTSCSSLNDSRIFFVNMLLSSVLVYNNFGVIDEQALSHLSLIIGMGQISQSLIHKQMNIQKPHLFWLVRDFILKLQSKSGQPFTSKEYLQNILDDQKGLTSSIVQKNCIRSMIKDMFNKRECQTLVRPAKQQKDLHSLSRIQFSQLRKQFLTDVKRFKQKLSKCIKYKKINNEYLTGNLILKLIKSCLNLFNNQNNQNIPTLGNIWQLVQSEQKRQITVYLQSISEDIKKSYFNTNKKSRIENSNENRSHIQIVESIWNEKIKSINILNNSQIKLFIQKKRLELIEDIQIQENKLIVPITFQDINFNFMDSIVHRDRDSVFDRNRESDVLQNRFQSFNQSTKNKSMKSVDNYKQSRFSTQSIIEKQLESTKKQLFMMKQKCRQFQKEREGILKAIENKEDQTLNINLKKKLNLISKNQEDETNIVSKLLEMYQKLQEKYQKINQMSKNTLAYICSHCKNKFEPHEFQKHMEKIKLEDISDIKVQTPISHKYAKTDRIEQSITQAPHQPKASFFTPYIIIPKGILSVDIQKTLIKEDQQHRNYIEYIIKVTLKHSKWTINRKYKDFCELHDILMIMLPQLDFPDSSALIKVGMLTSVSNNVNKKNIVEQRRKTLQNYLTQIIGIDEVRNTRILQKFLKVNQQYKELEYTNEIHHKSKSPFSSEIKPESKSGLVQRAQTTYSQTKKYTQSRVK